MNKSERNETNFTETSPSFSETFDHFLIFAEKVLEYSPSGELQLNLNASGNAVKAGLNGYRSVFNKSRESSKHVEKFREVYMKCRPAFLKELSMDAFMEWFSADNRSFTITPQEKSRNKICLSIIFRNSVRIAEQIADQAEKHPEKAEQLLNDPAAVYPEHFMLYLLRLFYHCADETDRKTMIIPRIQELESQLSLKKDEVPMVSNGISDIFGAISDIAREAGLDIPKNAPQINGSQIKEALGMLTSDENVKKGIKDVFGGVDLKNPKNITGVIGKVLEKMTQTAQETPEPVKRSMEATADSKAVVAHK